MKKKKKKNSTSDEKENFSNFVDEIMEEENNDYVEKMLVFLHIIIKYNSAKIWTVIYIYNYVCKFQLQVRVERLSESYIAGKTRGHNSPT